MLLFLFLLFFFNFLKVTVIFQLFYLVSEEIVGNYYSNLFNSSEEVALYLSRYLSSNLQAISAWHSSMILDDDSATVQTLPVWLQDILVNGLSFWRSGLYLHDGRWRQYESLDCIDVDSVHNDFQREIPYVLFYPDLVENVMRAWAKYQSEDGHIVETLAAGCQSPTRKMDRLVRWKNLGVRVIVCPFSNSIKTTRWPDFVVLYLQLLNIGFIKGLVLNLPS